MGVALQHTRLTANSRRGLKKAKSGEGSWSLASSSASLALRLQTASLSVPMMRAGTDEGGVGGATGSPVSLTSPLAGNSDGPGLPALEPGSGGDGGRVSRHSSGADVTRWLRCQRRGMFLNIHSFFMTPSSTVLEVERLFCSLQALQPVC